MRKTIDVLRASAGMLLFALGAVFVLLSIFVGGEGLRKALISSVDRALERKR